MLRWGSLAREGPGSSEGRQGLFLDFSALLGSSKLRGGGGEQMLSLLRSPPGDRSWPCCPCCPPTRSPGDTGKAGRATRPSRDTGMRRIPTLGPSCGAATLTLIEADLVSQDHHAFRQQLVLKSTHRQAVTAAGAPRQARPPGAPQPATEARGGGSYPCPPTPQPVSGRA